MTAAATASLRLLAAPFVFTARHRHVLAALTGHELRSRFASTVLGRAWLVLSPLLFLGLYVLMYVKVYRVQPTEFRGADQYLLHMFAGLVPFLAFAESMGAGTTSVVSSSNLVRNTLFPIELVPLKVVLVAHFTAAVALALVVAAALVLNGPSWAMLAALPGVALTMMLITGLAWMLSAVNVIVRDLASVISMVVTLLMMTSPIGYTRSMIPAAWRPLFWLNPMYWPITWMQATLVHGEVPSAATALGFLTLSLLTFTFGFFVFSRLKVTFADHV